MSKLRLEHSQCSQTHGHSPGATRDGSGSIHPLGDAHKPAGGPEGSERESEKKHTHASASPPA